ncbi:nicotinate phosphoribosyltransferase [Ostreibacterium oceani]|uniref:Nicotinamide phosphoribosyltransferase n=1 Tax=Ostreibacterium oceani TaxID=2654998 RepID=A0A6N7ERI8_9GAMM|nr:nicotinate phosphoribosyltransferase [Ostreibacterium oceani]MPV85151.1 nicotinate phosphoribosyltransferase [Ostreibacterium oceani]
MNINPILNIDSYKASHYLQYPPQTEYVSSYLESRGGKYADGVFFGLQIFLKQYLCQPITAANIDEAESILTAHGLPFCRENWTYILNKHQGYFPLRIQAVPEGYIIPTQNVLCQVINTDPMCGWLTSYIETALLRAIWYPTTVATISWHCRQVIYKYLLETADNTDGIDFKLHDFGARGVSSTESAAIGGLAHLVNFKGTDTVPALVLAQSIYGESMAGFSIPAAEHSTMTAWGQSREKEAYENMIDTFGGKGKAVAVVSDSYDLWHAIDHIWGELLHDKVTNNQGTIVIRPDSGDPVRTSLEAIERLMDKFGYHINSKGYRQLPDYIRLIQGDGINAESLGHILKTLKNNKISAENIAFGMGGSLLQKMNRDTMRFAMKASYACVAGQWRDVFKDPVTDSGKRSKRGRLALIKTETGYNTIRQEDLKPDQQDELTVVFENGQLTKAWSLETIRRRAQGVIDF